MATEQGHCQEPARVTQRLQWQREFYEQMDKGSIDPGKIDKPWVWIRLEMPQDAGQCWGLEEQKMTGEDRRDFYNLCRAHRLAWDCVNRTYYVMRDQLVSVHRDLLSQGWCVLVSPDAWLVISQLRREE